MVEDEKATRLHSLLMVTRNINQALLMAKNEPDLFQQICDSLAEVFKFSWIGLVEKGSHKVKPVAQAGFEEGYLPSINVTWDDSDFGKGPTGTAIKTGGVSVIKDIEADPRYTPWKEEAMKRGYASSIALPLLHGGETIGAINVYSEQTNAFGDAEMEFLIEVAGDIAVGVKTLRLMRELEQGIDSLQVLLNETVAALALMSEMRDPYTAGHQRRVSILASAIAGEMGFTEEQVRGIRIMGLLHDIGKIAIPAEILSKPSKMSESEFSIIKTHSQVGHEILKNIDFPWPVAQAVLQHHERLDGSGYPFGLCYDDIILEARILAVADVVEAMVAHRPYRPAYGVDYAIEEISQKKGVLYDPEAVDVCTSLFEKRWFEFS